MIYLRARYYDSTIGRFTSYDEIQGDISNPLDMNRYVYCRNNPIKYVDITGKSITIVIAGITLSAGQIALIGTTSFIVLKYFLDNDFRKAFKEAVVALDKTIENAIIYAKSKSKSIPSKLMDGDRVKTPDTHPGEFKKEKGRSTYKHIKTGWNFRKDKGQHGGEHWDASPSDNYGDYINVYPNGLIR